MVEKLQQTKGGGNFKKIVLRVPNGGERVPNGGAKGIQLIPIADVTTKDEFLNIKNISRDDILATHRVPPQLMRAIPNNTGRFGDVTKAAAVFAINEINLIQERILEINAALGVDAIKFDDYSIKGLDTED